LTHQKNGNYAQTFVLGRKTGRKSLSFGVLDRNIIHQSKSSLTDNQYLFIFEKDPSLLETGTPKFRYSDFRSTKPINPYQRVANIDLDQRKINLLEALLLVIIKPSNKIPISPIDNSGGIYQDSKFDNPTQSP
jgi:hypothetical protein